MPAQVNNNVVPNISHIVSGAGAFKVDTVQVGSFTGGVKLNHSRSEVWTEADYVLGKIDGERKTIGVQVLVDLDEATIEHIVMALGENTSSIVSNASSKTFDYIPAKTMIEHAISFEGQSPENSALARTFTCPRAVPIGGLNQTFMRGTKLVVPVVFELLVDANGKYYTINDRIL